MRVPILRYLLCWTLTVVVPSSLLGQAAATGQSATPGQPAGAILHTQGGVSVNSNEAPDSSAIFPGDVIETKSGFSANLVVEGSTVILGPESVAKFQGDYLELNHGSVSVGTSTGFKVRVNCIRVVPVRNEWTQYEVTDVSRSVQVSARKDDVNVEHETDKSKPTPKPELATSQRASVHEGEQHSYDESEICGAAIGPPAQAWRIPNGLKSDQRQAGPLCFAFCFAAAAAVEQTRIPSALQRPSFLQVPITEFFRGYIRRQPVRRAIPRYGRDLASPS